MQESLVATAHTVTVADYMDRDGVISTKTINAQPTETLLETLERHQLDVQYHCRDGFCGACRTKLIAGSVDYVSDPLAFIDDDECLPCCSKPNGPITIKIE